MKIDQAKIEIRGRTAWEAMDLGILLARHHISVLVRSWFVAFLPIYLVLLFLLHDYPGWLLFVLWWLKPVFDRLPLYILSRAIFSPAPTVKESVIYWWKNLRFYLFGDLIARRLSPSRSYLLPVYQLEKATRNVAHRRTRDFLGADSKAGWLTFVFLHIESFLTSGILAFAYFMLPGYSVWSGFDPLNPFDFLEELEVTFFWVYHIWAFIYFCVLSVTESIYVACGFSLYLNRRIIHEGWDLELGFRRLLKRLSATLVLVLMASAFYFVPQSTAYGAEVVSPYQTEQADAKDAIKTLLDEPPFRKVEEKRTIQKKNQTESKKAEVKKEKEESPLEIKIDESMIPTTSMMGSLMQIVVWGAVITVVALFIWYGKEMLPMFRQERAAKVPKKTIERFHGHEITPETLPDDILTAFEKAWAVNPRDALGLLYRYLISQLVHVYDIPLKEFHTENEVVGLTLPLNNKGLTTFTQLTTKYWQYVAYGGYELLGNDKETLVNEWRVFLTKTDDKGQVV